MTRQDNPWEEKTDPHAERRDEKQRPRMPVSGKSVLLLSRIVRPPSRKRRGSAAAVAPRRDADASGSPRSATSTGTGTPRAR